MVPSKSKTLVSRPSFSNTQLISPPSSAMPGATHVFVDGGSTFDTAQRPGHPRTIRINVRLLDLAVSAAYPDSVIVQKTVNCASHAHPTWLRYGFKIVEADVSSSVEAAVASASVATTGNAAVLVSGDTRILPTIEHLLASGWQVTLLIFARAPCAMHALEVLVPKGLCLQFLRHADVTYDIKKYVSPPPQTVASLCPLWIPSAAAKTWSLPWNQVAAGPDTDMYEQFLVGRSLLAAL